MTIKELEERTGMTRANIRYYEQEGLLAPARKENGYRSYSEEDCEDLLKIKLLRQLQFSLQEIRALQDSTLSLTQAMEGRSAVLEGESSALLSARDVCRTIEREQPGETDLHGWIFGCDACQSCCPWNRRAPQHRNAAFDPVFDPLTMDAGAWLGMDEAAFEALCGRTPLTRSGLDRIRRNVRE